MFYTEDNLKGLSIYQLRYLAHQVGVKAPTTKKSDELINEIIAIQKGELEPYFPQKKLGRPVKNNNFAIDSNTGAIISLESNTIDNKLQFHNDLTCDNLDTKLLIKGYVVESKDGEFFVVNYDESTNLQQVAWLPNKLLDSRRLRNGNFVEVETIVRGDNQLPMVLSIKEIEGQQYKGFYTEQFEHKKLSFDKDRYFSLMGGTVFYGERVIFTGDKHRINNYVLKLTNDIYNYCESVVFLGLNLTLDKVNSLKNNQNIELFYSLFSDSYDKQYFTYKLAVNHAKRLAELGKRVIFIVSNIESLYDNLQMSDRDKNISLKSLYGLARNFDGVGSFTIIGTCSQEFYDNNKDFEDYIDACFRQISKTDFEYINIKSQRDSIDF